MSTGNPAGASPFRSVKFIIAAAVVGLVVVAGLVISVMNLMRPNSATMVAQSSATSGETSAQSANSGPAPEQSAATTVNSEAQQSSSGSGTPEASICGLGGDVVEVAYLDKAPEVERWEYDGIFAYPTSKKHGPGVTADEGYRYCFQRSPEGVIYAAANATVQLTNSDTLVPWGHYILAEGPNREEILSSITTGQGSQEGARIEISGFRLLSYDGKTSSVDIALSVNMRGQTVYLSYIFNFVWENGDWKLAIDDLSKQGKVAQLPHISGYIPWAAQISAR